ncbi:germination-specific N-acetylmuramoyl-L-alanine amidase [Compostibacillus humi]|uniref:Germination-specific N-acetylmuramoyl-L-alanine amidase n=1 Tax=Compostibacillus humi TaxID=1245525 RepID=A0A8J2ZS46_9BACI|nr:N-acetylmuramoyl-L-alanine amidase CwlD [Compostibacillus humi]GGH74611.1 germination-specific N-acetylmuramoyl-L-alanine amidase [Compostibacillus humi]
MSRLVKIALWMFGLMLLIFLIRMPIQVNEEQFVMGFSLPLSGKVIVVDPGHGGPDGGAVGADGTLEKDIALNVSFKLRDFLQQAGAEVYMTRETDRDLAQEGTKGLSRRKSEDIRQRLAIIEMKNPDLFVSIHLNALSSTRWRGAQTFYYPSREENKHLARLIQEEIIRNLENTNREALSIDGVYLLKQVKSPGALVEIGFLSNAEERELLKQEIYQEKMAASIYEGILRFFTEELPEE